MFSRKVLGLMTFAFAFAALTAPSTAHASKARAEALHVSPVYTVDRVNVQTFPTALYRHQNIIFGELGVWEDATDSEFNDTESSSSLGDNDRAVGLYLGNLWEGRAGVFGIELNENGGALSPTHGSEFVNRNGNECISLIWAQQFNTMTLGLEFNQMSSKFEDKTPGFEGTEEPYNFFPPFLPSGSGSDTWEVFTEAADAFGFGPWNSVGFGAGVAFESQSSSGNTRLIELSGEYRGSSFKLEDVSSQQILESDGGAGLAFNGRAMLQSNQSLTWVPYAGFMTQDRSWKFTDGVTPANNTMAENKMTNFEGGIAGNWTLRQNDVLIAGAAFKSSTIEWMDPIADSLKVTYTQPICFFAGFEGSVARWLTLRFGASKPWMAKLKWEETGNMWEATDSPFNFALGTGFHFGNVHVDAVWNQDYTFSGGPLATSGFDSNIYPFSRISVSYRY